MSEDNVLPFRPAATGLQEEHQTALFADEEYIKLNPPKLTFPSMKSVEGITLALMLMEKEITQKKFWDELELSRLSAYIWELRQLGFSWIVAERCQDRAFRKWHIKSSDGAPQEGFVRRWNKYYLPKAFIDQLDPEAFIWAAMTFAKWSEVDLDAWDNAES